jgi:hypothetical protein
MSLEELRNALRQRPFRPFRMFSTDGGTYDIRHSELCMPGARIVIVGIPAAGYEEPTIDRYAVVDLLHITRFEPLEVAPPSVQG